MDKNGIEYWKNQLLSLTVLKDIKEGESCRTLFYLLECAEEGEAPFLKAYSDFVYDTMEKGSFVKMMREALLVSENLFAQKSVKMKYQEIELSLTAAVDRDLRILRSFFKEMRTGSFAEKVGEQFPSLKELLKDMPPYILGKEEELPIQDSKTLYAFYRKNGYGQFTKSHAFTVINGEIVPISKPDDIALQDLKGYEYHKSVIIDNTKLFLGGNHANNILLYGDKGTGKSSTVKAVVNYLKEEGLKIVEVSQNNLEDFQKVYTRLEESPFHFILFLDDISFSKEDDHFSALKAVIEGGIVKQPDNVLIYATSNRRHLIRESLQDREGDDIHLRDTMESVTSLHDRFGIEITFSVPGKDDYLSIVKALAEEKGIPLADQELFVLAERFAIVKGGRSPRTARQFVDFELSSLLEEKEK